tara:strand:+ start:3003 stop:3359 length:357 start_codon:yes stop_codon:yes gene_type:complete
MIKILEGDFYKKGYCVFNKSSRIVALNTGAFATSKYSFDDIQEFQELSQDNAKSVLGTLGWGTAGLVALGPLGALAGLLCGGNKKRASFVIKLNDGKVAICEGSQKEFTEFRFALGMI